MLVKKGVIFLTTYFMLVKKGVIYNYIKIKIKGLKGILLYIYITK
jgi:hypothetical protein